MVIHGSIIGEMMTRIICFDYTATVTTTHLLKQRLVRRTTYNYGVIKTVAEKVLGPYSRRDLK